MKILFHPFHLCMGHEPCCYVPWVSSVLHLTTWFISSNISEKVFLKIFGNHANTQIWCSSLELQYKPYTEHHDKTHTQYWECITLFYSFIFSFQHHLACSSIKIKWKPVISHTIKRKGALWYVPCLSFFWMEDTIKGWIFSSVWHTVLHWWHTVQHTFHYTVEKKIKCGCAVMLQQFCVSIREDEVLPSVHRGNSDVNGERQRKGSETCWIKTWTTLAHTMFQKEVRLSLSLGRTKTTWFSSVCSPMKWRVFRAVQWRNQVCLDINWMMA